MIRASLQVEGTTYSDWLIEHCKQVSRMLPTGLSIGGIYITETSPTLIEAKTGKSKVVMDLLNDISAELQVSQLLLMITSQGKAICGVKDSVRLVTTEFKAISIPELMPLRCLVPINIGVSSEGSSIAETFSKLMKQWEIQLRHLKLDISKGEVEVFSKTFGTVSKMTDPFLKISGVLEVVIMHTGSTPDKLLELMKLDLIHTLKHRIEILAECQEIMSAFPQSLKLPRRIVHTCNFGLICDYALHTEAEEASIARVAALLAAEPKTSVCREYCEVQSKVEEQVEVQTYGTHWRVAGVLIVLLLLCLFRKYIKKEHYVVHPSNIRFKTSFRNCIYEALKGRGWRETEHETDWDIVWAEKDWFVEVFDHVHLQPHQRVNHFRNFRELTRKDLMVKNLKRYRSTLEKEGRHSEAAEVDFFPLTYNMPGEYSLFVEEFKRNPNTIWIMKPIGKSQGKGIFLFTKLAQVAQWKNDFRWKPDNPQAEPYVVQRYVANPLLVGGKKFDLRIYVLVTSYSPLTAYLYRTGFARFTHHRYSSDPEDIANNFIHLTNVAIQKTSENYDSVTGGKWDLRQLKLFLMSKYGQDAVAECFRRIHNIFIRSLLAVAKIMINDKHCFELYGYDILIDSNLKPWLIEVNASPSFTANTPQDNELKVAMLDDAFTIIDMERVMRGNEEQVGGFDLIFRGAPALLPAASIYQTYLGSFNPRAIVNKKIAKQTAQRLALQAEQESGGRI